METKKRSIITIVITVVYVLVALLGVGLVNRNVLPHFSGVVRIIIATVAWWPLLLATVIFMRRDKDSLKEIGFIKNNIPMQILTGIFVAVGSLFIFIVLPAFFNFQMGYVSDSGILDYILQFFYLIFAVAFVEEVIFRGHLFKKLLDINSSKWFAIIVSSVLFGLFHIFNFNPLQIVVTTIMGIYWCVFREKVKHCTLLSLIIGHALHNLFIPVVTAFFF